MTRVWFVALALSSAAAAEPAADARAHAESFARACVAGDVAGVMALYADDAVVVWPGQGQEAKGRAEIERLVTGLCKGRRDPNIVLESMEAIALDDTHLATVGRWKDSFTTARGQRVSSQLRTTEVLVKRDGKWRYLVDHASVGVPGPRAAGGRRERRER
jgi:uncharacterized protein (TIGR02246 family)